MRVCVIGTGYVGLVTGVCLAKIGHDVICIDNNEEKVKIMQSGESPIFEPGLSELMAEAIAVVPIAGVLFGESSGGVKPSLEEGVKGARCGESGLRQRRWDASYR